MHLVQQVELICPLGGDFAREGAALGSRSVAALVRADKLARTVADRGRTPVIAVSPGWAKKDGNLDTGPHQPRRLAQMMQGFLVSALGAMPSWVVASGEEERIWGTHAEIIFAREVYRRLEREGKYVEKVHVVAGWWHSIRAGMIARHFFGNEVEVVMHPVWCRFEWAMLYELRNIPAEWLRLKWSYFDKKLVEMRGR